MRIHRKANKLGLTTDPNDPGLQEVRSDGQQKAYLVLPEQERALGYVRPVRSSYVHLACGTTTTMSRAIAETYAKDPSFYDGTFCSRCGTHFRLQDPKTGEYKFKWVGEAENSRFVGQ